MTDQEGCVSEWQPIETAPKRGDVLLWFDNCVHEGCWIRKQREFVEGWYWAGYSERPTGPLYPTHWMPLPDPPKETK